MLSEAGAHHQHVRDIFKFQFIKLALSQVPYFSWQRSHAVHHSKTNHMTEGETHVPRPWDANEMRPNVFQLQLNWDTE